MNIIITSGYAAGPKMETAGRYYGNDQASDFTYSKSLTVLPVLHAR